MQRNYIIREREFIKTNEDIYKIGKTEQMQNRRFNQYPKGSEILLVICVNDCHVFENKIKKIFNEKFIKRPDIGIEYYQGNINVMTYEIMKLYNEENNYNLKDNILGNYNEHLDIYLYFLKENVKYNDNKKEKILCSVLYEIFKKWFKYKNLNVKLPSNKEFVNYLRKYKSVKTIRIGNKTQLGIEYSELISRYENL